MNWEVFTGVWCVGLAVMGPHSVSKGGVIGNIMLLLAGAILLGRGLR